MSAVNEPRRAAFPVSSKRTSVLWRVVIFIVLVLGLAPGRALAQRALGTDVSAYQPSINWTTVKNAGVAFAWAKATEGTGWSSSYFAGQEANAVAVGIYIGAYHFARPSANPNLTGAKSADSEAWQFWRYASNYVKYGGSYCVPMLDWEDTGATIATGFTNATTMSAWVIQWCNTVSNYARAQGVSGLKPVIYTGAWYSKPSGTYCGLTTAVTSYPAWISYYPSGNSTVGYGTPYPLTDPMPTSTRCYPWTACNIWQYGDTNWSGGDADVSNGTLSQFVQMFVIGGTNAPIITTNPTNVTVAQGGSTTFVVRASGQAPLTYSWLFNGAVIPSATSSNYTIASVQSTNAGGYTAVVSNSYAKVPTTTAFLSVLTPSPPTITAQPVDVTAIAGSSVTFRVEASGSLPLGYQWQFNGTNLSAASNANYTCVNAQPGDAGGYGVVVTNSSGSVTSQVATLTVKPVFQTGGWSVLWSLASNARYYLASNSPPDTSGMAVNPTTGRLLLVNHTGPHVKLLDADSNADLGELNTSGVAVGIYMLQLIGVADDGVVYAGNLTYTPKYTAFQVHRWANDDPATVSTLAYSGDPGAGAFDRWGDTLAVRGAGTNTQIIVGPRTNNFVAIFTTTNGTNFASKLITVADAPIGAFAQGLAFGAGDTFWGKATSQALRQVAFDLNAGTGTTLRVHADPAFPNSVGPIGVHPQLNLLAGINVGVTGNNLRLYDLTPTNGTPVLLTSTNFATDNGNTLAGAGTIDFAGDRVYALGGNNGLVVLQLLPAPPAPALPGHFDAITSLANGSVQLSMSGSATTNYLLQCTSDWLTWSNLSTLSGPNGQFWWTDYSPTNTPSRFFRLRLAP